MQQMSQWNDARIHIRRPEASLEDVGCVPCPAGDDSN